GGELGERRGLVRAGAAGAVENLPGPGKRVGTVVHNVHAESGGRVGDERGGASVGVDEGDDGDDRALDVVVGEGGADEAVVGGAVGEVAVVVVEGEDRAGGGGGGGVGAAAADGHEGPGDLEAPRELEPRGGAEGRAAVVADVPPGAGQDLRLRPGARA